MRHLYEYLEFDSLSPEARKNAIENVREEKYKGGYGADDISYWVIDDDSLFEPSHEKMKDLFGDDYYEANGNQFMIENTRKNISYVGMQDPNYYLQCADAINVTNDNLFFRWLGIPVKYFGNIYYYFSDKGDRNTSIEIEFDGDPEDVFGSEDVPGWFEEMLEDASKKFDKHIDNVLKRISDDIDSQYEDDGIIETIESQDILFDEEGNIE